MSVLDRYKVPTDIPDIIPVFPLSGILLLPRGQLPLNIFEPRYLSMVEDAMGGEKLIGMIQPAREHADDAIPVLARTGTVGRITTWAETDDNRLLITLAGISRFKVAEELNVDTPYRIVRADYSGFENDLQVDADTSRVDRDRLISTLRDFVDAQDLSVDWEDIEDASDEALVNGLSMLSPYGPEEKQALLEVHDLQGRTELLIAITEMFLHHGDSETPIKLQ